MRRFIAVLLVSILAGLTPGAPCYAAVAASVQAPVAAVGLPAGVGAVGAMSFEYAPAAVAVPQVLPLSAPLLPSVAKSAPLSAPAAVAVSQALPSAVSPAVAQAVSPKSAPPSAPAAGVAPAATAVSKDLPSGVAPSVARVAPAVSLAVHPAISAALSRSPGKAAPVHEDPAFPSYFAQRTGETLLQRLGKVDPADAADRAKLFDGEVAPAANAVSEPLPSAVLSSVAQSVPPSLTPSVPASRPLSRDQYGGPRPIPAEPSSENGRFRRFLSSQWQQARYGLRWAVNLMGLSALLGLLVKPALVGIPWQLYVSEPLLESLGRVPLLTSMGPAAIAQAVAHAPFAFLLLGLPGMALIEELTFRVLQFGLAFLGLAALKPLAERADSVLKDLPDIFGLRAGAQRVLRALSRVSSAAYPLAASISAFSFAAAHIGAWGFAPFTFLSQFVLGLVLAHVAYRSRGVTAPFVSHLAYNLATVTLAFALPLAVSEGAAAVVAALAAVLSVGALWYNVRVYHKAKAAAAAAPTPSAAPASRAGFWRRLLTGTLIVPLLLGSLGLPALRQASLPYQPSAVVSMVQRLAPEGPQVSPGDPQAIEDLLRQAMQGHAVQAPPGQKLTAEQVIRQAKPAVVMVRTGAGSGTGFIVSREGLLVTNAHVVAHSAKTMGYDRAHAQKVMIVFANGRAVPARVVAFNPDRDLALIQLPPDPMGWPTVALGDSSSLVEGQEVVAMGYPLGQPFSASRGIVSGLGMRSNGYVRHIQTDAAINPGNSGGPLFNDRGEVVGVNTMIKSLGGGSDGIGLSIASKDVRETLEQYEKTGDILSAWLGAIFFPASPDAPSYGTWVEAVRPGSPAERAGLRAGDTVVEVDGRRLANDPQKAMGQLAGVARSKKPGETLKLTVSGRDGQVRAVEVTLGGR